jgi:L-gulonate 5-dehydrogenase
MEVFSLASNGSVWGLAIYGFMFRQFSAEGIDQQNDCSCPWKSDE